MRRVKSFSLSGDVVAMLEEIPKCDRSRFVNEALTWALKNRVAGVPAPALDEQAIRDIVRRLLDT